MLSQTVEYALRARVCLAAHPGEALTTAQVAAETRVPATYLAKVLRALGKAGLLEAFDVKQLTALCAPRPVAFADANPRARTELAGLKAWYETLGGEFPPVR